MNIDGFGTETIERLLNENIIKTFDDIYNIKIDQLVGLERMAQKSAENLVNAINNSKSQPFHKVIYSLGIRYVGETVSKKLANHFSFISDLINTSYEEMLDVDEIGEKIATSLNKYFSETSNLELINNLRNVGLNFSNEFEKKTGTSLAKLSFVITGTFETISRDSLKEIIRNNGGKVNSGVSSKSVIISGKNPGPSKMKKVRDLGLIPLSFEEFINLYKIKL